MYDLAIIGSGPAGYAAALRAAELGAKACIIEKDMLGGRCLNYGCIPTKAIITSLRLLREVRRAAEFGIDIDNYKLSIPKLRRRRDEVVSRLRSGAEAFLNTGGIDIVKGTARFVGPDAIDAGGSLIKSRHILIATGSIPVELKNCGFDHKNILDSTDLLRLDSVPKDIVIIGGGVIGCEFASIYNQLGSEVTIIEAEARLLPRTDKEIARRLENSFKKTGIGIIKNSKVTSAATGSGVSVQTDSGRLVKADKALLSVGYRPNVSALNIEAAGLDAAGGVIKTDEYLRTNVPNVFCAGDASGRYLLAHVASYEGALAVENIFGAPKEPNYSAIPNCIFTTPEAAGVGFTEDEAKESGHDFQTARLPFSAVSKAHIAGETEGLLKLMAEKKTHRILGAHILGAGASELIATFATAIRAKIPTDGLRDVIYAHPTLSESVSELISRITASGRA